MLSGGGGDEGAAGVPAGERKAESLGGIVDVAAHAARVDAWRRKEAQKGHELGEAHLHYGRWSARVGRGWHKGGIGGRGVGGGIYSGGALSLSL